MSEWFANPLVFGEHQISWLRSQQEVAGSMDKHLIGVCHANALTDRL